MLLIFMAGMLVGLFLMFTVYGGLRRTTLAILTHMLERENNSKYVVLRRADAVDYMGVPTIPRPGVGKGKAAVKKEVKK